MTDNTPPPAKPLVYLPAVKCTSCGDDVICQETFNAGVKEGRRQAAAEILAGMRDGERMSMDAMQPRKAVSAKDWYAPIRDHEDRLRADGFMGTRS